MGHTGVHGPPLALAIHKGPTGDHRLPAVGGMAHPSVNESEALPGLDGEGFGVVGHDPDPTGKGDSGFAGARSGMGNTDRTVSGQPTNGSP